MAKVQGFCHQKNDYLKIVPVTLMCMEVSKRDKQNHWIDEIKKNSCLFSTTHLLCCSVSVSVQVENDYSHAATVS